MKSFVEHLGEVWVKDPMLLLWDIYLIPISSYTWAMTLGIPLISSDTRFPYYTRQGLNLIFNEK
jgi:hypothetical protein